MIEAAGCTRLPWSGLSARFQTEDVSSHFRAQCLSCCGKAPACDWVFFICLFRVLKDTKVNREVTELCFSIFQRDKLSRSFHINSTWPFLLEPSPQRAASLHPDTSYQLMCRWHLQRFGEHVDNLHSSHTMPVKQCICLAFVSTTGKCVYKHQADASVHTNTLHYCTRRFKQHILRGKQSFIK